MNAMLYIILGSFMWTLHTVCIKLAGARMHPVLVTWIFYLFAIMTTTALLLVSGQKPALSVLAADTKLLGILVVAGVTIGLTDYLVVTGLAKGAPLSLAIPVFSTLGIALTVLTGVIFFRDAVTPVRVAGLILSAAGIFMMMK